MRTRTNPEWSTFIAPEIYFAFRGKLLSPAEVYEYFIRYVLYMYGFSAKHFRYVPTSCSIRVYQSKMKKKRVNFFYPIITVTFGWLWRIDAGKSSHTSPSSNRLMAGLFFSPDASSKISLLSIIV